MDYVPPPDAEDKFNELFSELVTMIDAIARGPLLHRIIDDRKDARISETQAIAFAEAIRSALRGFGAAPEVVARLTRESRRRLLFAARIAAGDESEAYADELLFTCSTFAMTWFMALQDFAEETADGRTLDTSRIGNDMLPRDPGAALDAFIASRLALTAASPDEFRRILCFVAGKYAVPRFRLPFAMIELLSLDGITAVPDPAPTS